MNKSASIYIHFPFCKSKCSYCTFNSITDLSLKEKYINKLIEEISSTKINSAIDTIYFGGGTPSIMTENEIKLLVNIVKENNQITDDCECTIEVNPESVSEEKLVIYKQIGINRISIGIQSLQDLELKSMNRIHSSLEAMKKLELVSKFFNNISCDLIVGFKENKTLIDTVEKLKNYAKSLSIYLLSFDEKTILDPKETYIVKNEDECMDRYTDLVEYLLSLGYIRYEISNFAFPGYHSRHNMKYWSRGTYYGFGAGAHSFISEKNIRYSNSDNIEKYLNDKGKSYEHLIEKDIFEEEVMLGLRTIYGIDKKYVNEKILTEYKGFYLINNDKFILNNKGMNIMNRICLDIIELAGQA